MERLGTLIRLRWILISPKAKFRRISSGRNPRFRSGCSDEIPTRDFHPKETGEAPQPPEAYSLAEFAGVAEGRQMAAIGPGCFAAQAVRASGVGFQALLRPEARDDRAFPGITELRYNADPEFLITDPVELQGVNR